KSTEDSKPGTTIMPIIVLSDKTQVTLFCNKAAYPVYITIGNLPKDIHNKPSQRGQILLGYLPTTKLEHISNKAACHCTLADLFHACMSAILLPLHRLGVEGMEMESGDSVVRRVHPIFAAYVGDYLEQGLVAGGITSLSQLTGREHGDICYILLGLIIDMRLPNGLSSGPLVRAVRALMDFLYLAQYPIHSDESLAAMEDALQRFHDNKDIFIVLGVCTDFNLPKLHFLCHYLLFIYRFGTTDNFNTEYTERLHIDFAKEAYCASNCKDEYPQMTLWLEQKEKVLRHEQYIQWCENSRPPLHTINPIHFKHARHIHMSQYPSAKAVPFKRLAEWYGANNFCDCLAHFITQHNHSRASCRELEELSALIPFAFHTVSVYHKAKFWENTFSLYHHASDDYDVLYVTPSRLDKRGYEIPG
ncbi:hypothetical protein PHLCEN_2v4721, partial [Hermanssonia centrifuga]